MKKYLLLIISISSNAATRAITTNSKVSFTNNTKYAITLGWKAKKPKRGRINPINSLVYIESGKTRQFDLDQIHKYNGYKKTFFRPHGFQLFKKRDPLAMYNCSLGIQYCKEDPINHSKRYTVENGAHYTITVSPKKKITATVIE